MVASLQNLASESVPQVKVFPNPAASEISVQGLGIKQVLVYNQSGQIVISQESSVETEDWKLNLSKLAYIIQVSTHEGIVSKKLIKP